MKREDLVLHEVHFEIGLDNLPFEAPKMSNELYERQNTRESKSIDTSTSRQSHCPSEPTKRPIGMIAIQYSNLKKEPRGDLVCR